MQDSNSWYIRSLSIYLQCKYRTNLNYCQNIKKTGYEFFDYENFLLDLSSAFDKSL